ncbi:MAG: transcription antitermination factor NusB [Myxococcales bacterium]|nr:transcription antitermination factor NusB [Myxococcales bacterium]MCB9645532.1 transcription antitermination factor NusB [Deltaproteobacteria bacterium]
MGARRRARECALMTLYSMDVAGHWPDTALERFFTSFGDGEPLDPPPSYAPPEADAKAYRVTGADEEMKAYATLLVEGVGRHMEELDALIQGISRNWRMARMAVVDRNVLRLAAFELTHQQADVPRKVAINEAIEVAKRFGTSESGAFVNGILDRIGKKK